MHLTYSRPDCKNIVPAIGIRMKALMLAAVFCISACANLSNSDESGIKVPQSPLLGAVERKSGLIAFISSDGNIYTMNQAGQDLTQITTDATFGDGQLHYYSHVTWSPDGSQIAYVSYSGSNPQDVEAQLYVSQSNGANAREIFASDRMIPRFLYWAPNSNSLAFLSAQKGSNSQILRLSKLDGTESQVLDSGQPLFWSWTPSSKRMLIHGNGSGPGSRLAYLWLGNTIIEDGLQVHPASFQAPDFSPDGNHIIFAGITDDGNSALITLERTTGLQNIIAEYQGTVSFQWSPIDDHIAFTSSQDDTLTTQNQRPLTVMRNQTSPIQLLSTGENVIGFFWSPDGTKIAYFQGAVSQGGEIRTMGQFTHLELHVIKIPQGESKLLFSFVPSEQFATLLPYIDQYQRTLTIWSPDSQYLAISGYTQQGPAIVVAQAEGDFEPRVLEPGILAVWAWK